MLCYLVFLVVNTLISDGIKCYYCLSDNQCVTVWKKGNGEVFVIPGKYESNKEPDISHIKTINSQYLTLYFTSQAGYDDKIIVRDEGNLQNSHKMYSIINDLGGKWTFVEYSDVARSLVYEPEATKFKDVRAEVNYLTISIEENFAVDKSGRKVD